jgi:AraC-like DNA-binding protein
MRSKRSSSPPSGFPWKRRVFPTGYEFYHYPTPLARRLWLYPRAIGRTYQTPSFLHGHNGGDGYLLHFVLRGALWHRLRDRQCTARPGDACLLDLAETVTYGNAGRGTVEFYWVLFSGRDVPVIFQELRARQDPLYVKLPLAQVRAVFRELMDMVAKYDPLREARISALLTMLLAELFESRRPSVEPHAIRRRRTILSEMVKRSLDYISRGYDHPITIKEMSTVIGASQFHFTRLFHREIGMPPTAYLNRYRVERAKELLEHSNCSIAAVGRRVGIPNQNYFARLFRRIVGTSPRRYRAKLESYARRQRKGARSC